ncbi:hypothetical protein ABFT80_16350 [Mesorhizobium sp. SB112]|uniref:hypothetical protein n=1 Tax=Mesorhizobium sp. SB112 TaxID=3151853 RepID=UPI003266DE17
MSEDPETARQIAELAQDTRPLLVLDVDEVVLEFVRPLMGFLNSQNLELKTDTFRLDGNIVELGTTKAVESERVSELIHDFFVVQAEWQEQLEDAADSIAEIARGAEIVLLTAMPHRHRETRRAHLDRLGFHYPLLTTERAKGPALRALRGKTKRPIAFVDDTPHNLVSARANLSDAHLFHMMAFEELRPVLPPLPDDIIMLANWRDATPKIAASLGL